MKKVNVLTVSLVAVMAVASARADIASTTYVDDKIQPVETKIDNHIADTTMHVTTAEKTAWNAKQTTENMEANTSEYSVNSTTKYPSMAVAQDMIEKGTSSINTNITNLTRDKQNKIAAGTAGNVVTYSGTAGTVGSLGFDTAPTADSANLVKSGAIKTALDAKQDTISDLGTIRSGAAAGATAVQPAAISDMETQTHAAATYQAKALVTNFTDADDTHYPSAKAVDTAIKAATTAASSGAADALQDAKDYADGKFQVKSTKASIGGANGTWTELTDAQLAAMNSGVKAADVAQITTNKNDIATLNGDANTNGSVAKSIADAITGLDLANTYDAKGSAAAAQTAATNAAKSYTDTAISDMQVKSNISTNVTTDKDSDTKYPSAKAVYTAVEAAKTAASGSYQSKLGGTTATAGKVVTATATAGEVEYTQLGSLATKSSVAKTDLASALKTEIEGKANSADLGTAAAKNVSTNGVAANDTGLVTGGQVQTAISNLNLGTTYQAKSDSTVAAKGNYIAAGSDVKGNLVALDTQLKTTTDTANAAIPKPSGTCTDCVLHFNGTKYSWEEVGR